MTRFVATTLDLSRLPAPTVIGTVDYDAILAARISDLTARLQAAGIPYDVGSIKADPFSKLQRTDAWREMIDLQRINEAAKAVMLPYAEKGDLDIIGALFGVERLEGEEDTAYRARIALAPEAYASAGSAGAYAYHARAVSARIVDVGVTSPSSGVAEVVLLFAEGTSAEVAAALVTDVNARLQADEIRPLTDHVVVMAAEVIDYAIVATLVVPSGPDPSVVAAAAMTSLLDLAARAYRVGRSIDESEIAGAAWTANTRRVSVTPAGVTITSRQAPRCVGIMITPVVVND